MRGGGILYITNNALHAQYTSTKSQLQFVDDDEFLTFLLDATTPVLSLVKKYSKSLRILVDPPDKGLVPSDDGLSGKSQPENANGLPDKEQPENGVLEPSQICIMDPEQPGSDKSTVNDAEDSAVPCDKENMTPNKSYTNNNAIPDNTKPPTGSPSKERGRVTISCVKRTNENGDTYNSPLRKKPREISANRECSTLIKVEPVLLSPDNSVLVPVALSCGRCESSSSSCTHETNSGKEETPSPTSSDFRGEDESGPSKTNRSVRQSNVKSLDKQPLTRKQVPKLPAKTSQHPCLLCSRIFSETRALEQHKIWHIKQESLESSSRLFFSDVTKTTQPCNFQCIPCGHDYGNLKEFTLHMDKHHPANHYKEVNSPPKSLFTAKSSTAKDAPTGSRLGDALRQSSNNTSAGLAKTNIISASKAPVLIVSKTSLNGTVDLTRDSFLSKEPALDHSPSEESPADSNSTNQVASNEVLTCRLCPFQSADFYAILEHVSTHKEANEKIAKCCFCDMGRWCSTYIVHHLRTHHCWLTCKYCEEQLLFQNTYDHLVEKHSPSHTVTKGMKSCPICSYTTSRLTRLKSHCASTAHFEHNTRIVPNVVVCPGVSACDDIIKEADTALHKPLVSSDILETNDDIPTTTKSSPVSNATVKCRLCPFRSRTTSAVIEHAVVHISGCKPAQAQCCYCQKSSLHWTKPHRIRQHITQWHCWRICRQCNEHVRPENTYQHITEAHKSKSSAKNNTECPICKITQLNIRTLKVHCNTAIHFSTTGVLASQPLILPDVTPQKTLKKVVEPVASNTDKKKIKTRRSMRRIHMFGKKKKFCPHCPRHFYNARLLTEHIANGHSKM